MKTKDKLNFFTVLLLKEIFSSNMYSEQSNNKICSKKGNFQNQNTAIRTKNIFLKMTQTNKTLFFRKNTLMFIL